MLEAAVEPVLGELFFNNLIYLFFSERSACGTLFSEPLANELALAFPGSCAFGAAEDAVVDAVLPFFEVHNFRPELAVELVASHAGEIVTAGFGANERAVEVVACHLQGLRLRRASALEDFQQGLFAGHLSLLFLVPLLLQEGELLHEFVKEAGRVVLSVAESREQREHGKTPLAGHTRARGDFLAGPLLHIKVQPLASERMNGALYELVLVDVAQTETLSSLENHARRAYELRHHDPLGAVDDESAPVGHLRELADEDGLLLDLAGQLVDEASVHKY